MTSIAERLKSGGRHTVVVVLPIEEEGIVKKTEIKVVYRGVSLEEGEAIEERRLANEDSRAGLVNALAEVVIEIREGQEVVTTDTGFFKSMDTFFLNRIAAAVRSDQQGPN